MSAPTDDDLARNEPGHALLRKIAEERRARSRFTNLLRDLLGVSRRDTWYVGLTGERAVGRALARLVRDHPEWRVLHSLPDPVDRYYPEKDIDHLVIGPRGVFALNTKHHRGKKVRIGDDQAFFGGSAEPYPRSSRREAARASDHLSRACRFPVTVQPVLVFVAARSVRLAGSNKGETVPALHAKELARWLLAFPGRGLSPHDIETVHAHARRPETWRRPR